MPAIGLVEAAIDDNTDGYVIAAGQVEGLQLDPATHAVGEALYVSTTAGELQNSKPTGDTDKVQKVALVSKVSSNANSRDGWAVVMGAGRVNDQNNELVALIGREDGAGNVVGTTTDTSLGTSPGAPIADNSSIWQAFKVVAQDLGVPNDGSVTEAKIDDGAVTRSKLAVDIDDSVMVTHVTNAGSVTEVALQHAGHELAETEVGIPLNRACETNNAVVVWRADNAPTGDWTLTLKKKAAGSRTYTTAATLSVTVNNG